MKVIAVALVLAVALAALLAPARAEEQGTICTVCSMIVQVVEGYVSNNATEQQILAKLDGLCADLPNPYGDECVLLVNTYGLQIINFVVQKENPALICSQLSLCPAPPQAAEVDVTEDSMKRFPGQCGLCESLMKTQLQLIMGADGCSVGTKLACNLAAGFKSACQALAAVKCQICNKIKVCDNNRVATAACRKVGMCG